MFNTWTVSLSDIPLIALQSLLRRNRIAALYWIPSYYCKNFLIEVVDCVIVGVVCDNGEFDKSSINSITFGCLVQRCNEHSPLVTFHSVCAIHETFRVINILVVYLCIRLLFFLYPGEFSISYLKDIHYFYESTVLKLRYS